MHRVNNAYLSTPLRIHDNQGKQRRDAIGPSRKVDSTMASTFLFSFSFYAALRSPYVVCIYQNICKPGRFTMHFLFRS